MENNRLEFILEIQHPEISEKIILQIKNDILQIMKKYIKIDPEKLNVKICCEPNNQNNQSAIVLLISNLPLEAWIYNNNTLEN